MNDAYIDICYEASVAIKDGEKTIELALDNFSKIKGNKTACKLMKRIVDRSVAITAMLECDPDTYDKAAFEKKYPILKSL